MNQSINQFRSIPSRGNLINFSFHQRGEKRVRNVPADVIYFSLPRSSFLATGFWSLSNDLRKQRWPGKTTLNICGDEVIQMWCSVNTESHKGNSVKTKYLGVVSDIDRALVLIILRQHSVALTFFRHYKRSGWRLCACAINVKLLLCNERTIHLW